MSRFVAASATQEVFELTLVRPVWTEAGEHPRLAHLWWRAPQQGGRVVQVYVDDALADVALDPAQRELWLSLDRSMPRRIDLVALDPALDDPWRPVRLSSPVRSVAAIALLRDEALAVDTQVQVCAGEEVLDAAPLWGDDEHRSGFGGLFGVGAFGFDAATGPGLGLGELGAGPLGSDNTAWRWRRDDLAAGEHALQLQAASSGGEASGTPALLAPIVIERLADPPANLRMGDDFTLTWDLP